MGQLSKPSVVYLARSETVTFISGAYFCNVEPPKGIAISTPLVTKTLYKFSLLTISKYPKKIKNNFSDFK